MIFFERRDFEKFHWGTGYKTRKTELKLIYSCRV